MEKISSEEFTYYIAYRELTAFEPELIHYYLAQIAMEVHYSQAEAKDKRKAKLQDFMIRPSTKKFMTKEEYTAMSKARWSAMLGRN